MMIKKIVLGTFVLIIVAAGATALYQTTFAAGNPNTAAQVSAAQAALAGQGSGQGGNGYRGGQGGQTTQGTTGGHGQAAQNQQQDHATMPAAVPGSLDETEIAGLVFMREEEKLAADVYSAMYELWGAQVFQNIASSEQMHTSSVQSLLTTYGIADPAQAEPGVFTNPELQALYNDLVAQGSQSLADALKVGAAIEEIDILDLQKQIAQTDNADLAFVYNNLMNGSSSHLSAFASNLMTATGETYVPQYMSAADYEAALSTASGNHGAGGQGYQGGRNNP